MSDRQRFIKHFFEDILLSDYVLLKFTDDSIHTLDIHTDLDILITKNKLKAIFPLIQNQDTILKIKRESKASMDQIFIFFKDSSFLQIDFLFGFYRKRLSYLNHEEVMEHAIFNLEKIRVCAAHHLLEHVFLFQFLNGAGVPSKYINYFKNLPPATTLKLLDFLNDKYKIACKSFDELIQCNVETRKSVYQILKMQRENIRWNGVMNSFKYWRDILLSIRNKRGFTITFSGVDGAGKSTIIEAVKNILENKFRKNVIVLRHRPSLLPILSSYKHGKKTAEKIAADTLPRQGKNKSKISSIIRFTYYFIDYLLGQFYVKVKYHWRGYAVLYDRYYFDFIIDGRRSNIDLPIEIPRFLYKFIYKAPLNLFLFADSQTILARKQELPDASIIKLTAEYKHLFNDLSSSKKVDNRYITLENIDKEKTLKTIIDHYVDMA
jgi:thymidylate kinase